MKRKWRAISETRASLRKSPFALLVWHFLYRLFAGEAFSNQDDLRLGIAGILGILALPGAILPILLLSKYSSLLRWMMGVRQFDYNTASIPDKYTFVTLTMVAVGIVTALKWDSMFPDRLDYANLAPLTISAGRVLRAKFIGLLLFAGLFIFSLNSASTILFPLVATGDQTRAILSFRFVAAHAVATFAGGAFMFFFFVALAGLLLTVLPYRRFRQISPIIQFAVVIALVILLFLTPEVGSAIEKGKSASMDWLPTVWFLGVYQTLSSSRAEASFHVLAIRGIFGLSGVAAAAVCFWIASYQRFFLRISEIAEGPATAGGKFLEFREKCLSALAPRHAYEGACFRFAAKTLARSQRHALLLAGFTGLGTAVAIQDLASRPEVFSAQGYVPSATVLAAPTAIIFCLLTGLVFIFGVPAELRANWMFQAVSERKCDVAQRVARRLMLILLAPLVAVVTMLYSAAWGARLGIGHGTFVLVTSWVLVEALLMRFRKIPFTCSYSSAKHNVGMILLAYFVAFLIFSPGLASVERLPLFSVGLVPLVTLLTIFAAIAMGIRRYGRESEITNGPLLFVDDREPLVPSMELR